MIELPEQAASLHMSMVILWSNSMCMVFSDTGEQMPEFQGRVEVVAPLINAVYRGPWKYGDWNKGIISDYPLEKISMEKAQRILEEAGFRVVQSALVIAIGEERIAEPVLGVEVSHTHHCLDPLCDGVHLIGTQTAIELMSEYAFRRYIVEDVYFNR